jgi:hypothetical protein
MAAAHAASMTARRFPIALQVLLSSVVFLAFDGPVAAAGLWRGSSVERLLWKGETDQVVIAGTRLADQELMVAVCVQDNERGAAQHCEFWKGVADLQRTAYVAVPDSAPDPPILVASASDPGRAAMVYKRVKGRSEHELGIIWVASGAEPYLEPVPVPSGDVLDFDVSPGRDGGFYLAWTDATDEHFSFAMLRHEKWFKIYFKHIAGVATTGDVAKACRDGRHDCMDPRIQFYRDGLGILYGVSRRYRERKDAVGFSYPDGRDRELRSGIQFSGTCGFAPEADGNISAAWLLSWSTGTGGKLEWVRFDDENQKKTVLLEHDGVQSCEGPFVVDGLGRYLVFMRRPEASVFVEEGDLMIAFSRFGDGRPDVERLAVGDGLVTYEVIPSATGSLDVVVARRDGATTEVEVRQFTLGLPMAGRPGPPEIGERRAPARRRGSHPPGVLDPVGSSPTLSQSRHGTAIRSHPRKTPPSVPHPPHAPAWSARPREP